MKIRVNEKFITIFEGAVVEQAVALYDPTINLKSGHYIILDSFGYQTNFDGELTNGQRLFIRKKI